MSPDTLRQTVLIVDDTPVNIQLLGELLDGDYDVCFATSGAEALEILSRTQPDLILLDVMMPGMSGYDVCARLKADPLLCEIPVIFITALSQQNDEINGLKAGAVDYITKPFNPMIVKLRVKNQLELKRYRDIHARQALLDGLTGIPNRRAFDEQLQREWSRMQRSRTELSLILLDIDHFKQYNDTYGHLEGDECLRRVVAALLSSLRASDFAARYGGEEFVCILPETDRAGTAITAERIRRAVELLKIPHASSLVTPWVTVSLGCATQSAECEEAPDQLVASADRMLYQAKTEGRNRVAQERSP